MAEFSVSIPIEGFFYTILWHSTFMDLFYDRHDMPFFAYRVSCTPLTKISANTRFDDNSCVDKRPGFSEHSVGLDMNLRWNLQVTTTFQLKFIRAA